MSKRRSLHEVPQPGEGKRGEDGHVGYLLRQAAASHRHRMENALVAFGVTPPQFAVLTMLNAYPGYSNAELARLALLTPQTVSVIVANLERSGLVARRAHEAHGRIQRLDLTAKGLALLNDTRASAHALEADLVSGLTPEEERIVRRWLASAAIERQSRQESK